MRLKGYYLKAVTIILSGCAMCFAQQMNAKDAPCRDVASTLQKVDCLSKALESSNAELNIGSTLT
jgi:hypothetical protein